MIDQYFAKSTEPRHPRLRKWSEQLKSGLIAALEVYRPATDLGETQPEMYLQFQDSAGTPLPLESVAWSDELNDGLIELGVKSISEENEAERFALGLRAALRSAEREFGDGYFSAVLVEKLKTNDWIGFPEIAQVLKHAYANRPFREGGAATRVETCGEMIDDAIRGRANELTNDLGYVQDDAERILVSAVARYLDDRFSVTSRRRMGML